MGRERYSAVGDAQSVGLGIVDWVVTTVPTMGGRLAPPGMLGIGIGGTAEKAAVMAKESLMEPIDIRELKDRMVLKHRADMSCDLRSSMLSIIRGSALQGLGGLTTWCLDVKVLATIRRMRPQSRWR